MVLVAPVPTVSDLQCSELIWQTMETTDAFKNDALLQEMIFLFTQTLILFIKPPLLTLLGNDYN